MRKNSRTLFWLIGATQKMDSVVSPANRKQPNVADAPGETRRRDNSCSVNAYENGKSIGDTRPRPPAVTFSERTRRWEAELEASRDTATTSSHFKSSCKAVYSIRWVFTMWEIMPANRW